MHDLQRLRYVTERYAQLQGLRLLPLGIPFLVSSLWRGGHLAWVPATADGGARLWFVALMAAAVALSFVAKAYYRRRFGDVSPESDGTAVLASTVFAGLLIVAGSLQGDASVSLPALIVALGLAYVGVAGGHVRPHYLAVASLVALFAGLGVIGVPFQTRSVLCDQLIALGVVIIGVGDHLVLCRTLAAVPRVETV